MELEARLSLAEVVTHPNVAELLSEDDLRVIGLDCLDRFNKDKDSRMEWEENNAEANALALQLIEEKTFPWPNASNVKFPLVTIAALQYHSTAYATLLPHNLPVQVRVLGEDTTGAETDRSRRLSAHMSFQLIEEDEGWEEDFDKALLVQAISGCAFKKTYYDPLRKQNMSELVLPNDFVVNYYTKRLDDQAIGTHILPMTRNEIYERVMRGFYLDQEYGVPPTPPEKDAVDETRDEREGVTEPPLDDTTPSEMLEQHTLLDLDGDGYSEPYIVTLERVSGKVARIVARFYSNNIEYNANHEVIRIQGECHFTKYPFVPSPDGGFYDIGFGALLGPLNESINTIINQLIDGGTMSLTAGGLLGRGARIRGGNTAFAPWEWKRVDSTGDDLRKNLVPLPVREPSQVLYTLLELLINFGQRIGMAVDAVSGVLPGQNTPAETSRNARADGLKIFKGIYRRTWRSLRGEFNKLFRLNQLFLDQDKHFVDLTSGANALIRPDDYRVDNTLVRPAADPFVISEEERLRRSEELRAWGMQTPGVNIYEVNRRWLEARQIPAIDSIYPDPSGPNAIPQGKSEKIQIEEMRAQIKQLGFQVQMKQAQMKLMPQLQKMEAEIYQIQSQAADNFADADLKTAQARGLDEGHAIARFNALLGAMKEIHNGMLDSLRFLNEIGVNPNESGNNSTGLPGLGGPPSNPVSQGTDSGSNQGSSGSMG